MITTKKLDNLRTIDRMVNKEIDKTLEKEYQTSIVQRRVNNLEFGKDMKNVLVKERVKSFFETGVTVYGGEMRDRYKLLELETQDYKKVIEDSSYIRTLALNYLSSEPKPIIGEENRTNLEMELNEYVYNKAMLNFKRSIQLNNKDNELLSLFMEISKNNADTVTMTYEQDDKEVEVMLDVNSMLDFKYNLWKFPPYSEYYVSFPNYSIVEPEKVMEFRKEFSSEDNPNGDILFMNIKKVTYNGKKLFEKK